MRIELIYFAGCPNADRARENVRAALEAADLGAPVEEWERDDPSAPAYVRSYSSPTVLVDGRDVTGVGATGNAASCRADGAPPVALIRQAIARS